MQWFLIVVMSFLLVGCGGGGSSAAIPTEPVANSAPVITDPGSLGVPGGATDVVAISATDADADTLSFSIVSGDDQGLFTITTAGVLSFITAPDFTAPGDVNTDNEYLLSVQVSDGTKTGVQALTVIVEESVEGRVVDAPMAGALVFVDLDGNFALDSATETLSERTDAEGHFQFRLRLLRAIATPDAKFVTIGGTDILTGIKMPGLVMVSSLSHILNAPAGSVGGRANITPLTTLIAAASTDATRTQILTVFGLTGTVESLQKRKGWEEALAGNVDAQKEQRVSNQISLVMQAAISMANDDSLSAAISNAVVGQIAALIEANGSIDLTSPATISTVLNGAITAVSANTTFAAGTLAEIATAVSYSSVAVGDATVDPTSEEMKSRATVSQSSLQDSIKSVVSGATSIVDFAAETLASFDADGDGIRDLNDAFPSISLGTLTDTDKDGRPDTCDDACITLGMTEDLDDDNDGVLDTADGYPLVNIGLFTDTDSDGRPDECDDACSTLGMTADNDDDNDGILDAADSFPLVAIGTLTDTDQDGLPNDCDDACIALGMTVDGDDDNDGVIDVNDEAPLNANVQVMPTATGQALSLNLLPIVTNTVTATLASTAQDSRAVTYAIVTAPTLGTVTMGDSAQGDITYTTTGNLVASDTFTYKVNDGFVDSEVATITIAHKTDPLYLYQWHLDNLGADGKTFSGELGTKGADLNLDTVISSGITGEGVTVAIVGTAADLDHPDLIDNILLFNDANLDLYATTDLGSPEQIHATRAAGIIAATGWNDVGGRGVAPNAKIQVYSFVDEPTLPAEITGIQENAMLGEDILLANADIFNLTRRSSVFGAGVNVTLKTLVMPTTLDARFMKAALMTGVNSSRNAKGVLYITSLGDQYYVNENRGAVTDFSRCGDGDNAGTFKIGCVDLSFWDQSRIFPEIISVSGLTADNTKVKSSTPGSVLWVSAPAGDRGQNTLYKAVSKFRSSDLSMSEKPGVMTTTATSCNGQGESTIFPEVNRFHSKDAVSLGNVDCRYSDSGRLITMSTDAGAMVSGVVALMLEANPDLGWRDVKHILATTAVLVDTAFTATAINTINYVGWVTNGSGLKHHSWYGFGAVDAAAAVTVAQSHTNLIAPMTTSFNDTADSDENIGDNANATVFTKSIVETGAGTIEHVRVRIKFDHAKPNQLGFRLESSTGTVVPLLPPFTGLTVDPTSAVWSEFATIAFYGEDKAGTWKVLVIDHVTGEMGNHRASGISFMYR